MCVRALQPVCAELYKRISCSSPHFWWQKKSKCGIDVCAGAPIGTLNSDTEAQLLIYASGSLES